MLDASTLKSEAEAFTVELRRLQEEMKNKVLKRFNDSENGIVAFLKQNPEIAYVTWTQYTPYFNDGDECIFHIWDTYVIPASKKEEYEEDGKPSYADDYDIITNFKYGSSEDKASINPDTFAKAQNIADFISIIPEEIMKDAFGDHIQVIVSAKGVEIEEHEHE